MLSKFDALVEAMLTKPALKVLGKKAAKLPASNLGASAGYAGTQIRADKSVNASVKRKYKSPR